MPDSPFQKSSRREFLMASATSAAGLTLGFLLPTAAWGQAAGRKTAADAVSAPWQPNAFVRIDTDDTITVIVKHL
jgi:isoquinoline 1-oxidoreductase subunit beta